MVKAWFIRLLYYGHVSLKCLSSAQMTEKGTFGKKIYLQKILINKTIYVFGDVKATKKNYRKFFL